MIEKYPILVIAPVIGIIANTFTHLIVSRLNKGRRQILCLIGGFVIGLVCTFIFALFAYVHQNNALDFFAYLILDIIAYTAFSYGYFHLININLASLRIRILHEIIISPSGLSEQDILRRYNAEQIIDNRIKRFINTKQFIERDGRYFLGQNKSFLILFWLFEVLKFVFLGRGNRLLKAGN
jgi:hypothetical protein